MPLYLWQDSKTNTKVEILRSFDDYEDTPTLEEALKEEMTEEEYKDAEWVKIVTGGAASVGFGARGLGGGKGFWVLFLALLGCGKQVTTGFHDGHTLPITEISLPCTVEEVEHKALITCPDGTSTVVFPKEIIVGPEVIEVPIVIKETEIIEVERVTVNTEVVEVPTVIKDTEIIEVDKVIKETEIVEVPVIVKETEIVEVEKIVPGTCEPQEIVVDVVCSSNPKPKKPKKPKKDK